jgi:3-phenylpropionate/cinnamic acid dioxygenase small subunit
VLQTWGRQLDGQATFSVLARQHRSRMRQRGEQDLIAALISQAANETLRKRVLLWLA